MKQMHVYTVDLTKLCGSGDFPCPRCGAAISPEDVTEEAYSILEPKINSQGLEELVIRCNKCESEIHLTGFSLLQKLEINEAKQERQKEATRCYVAHV
jgi:hypothetical protein